MILGRSNPTVTGTTHDELVRRFARTVPMVSRISRMHSPRRYTLSVQSNAEYRPALVDAVSTGPATGTAIAGVGIAVAACPGSGGRTRKGALGPQATQAGSSIITTTTLAH